MKNPVTFTNLVAETYKMFESIEGRRMKYDRWEGIQQHRADIFMKFWEMGV